MILVTGATGQLGSHVLFELAKEKKSVRALYRDTEKISRVRQVFRFYQDGDDLFNTIEWFQADINDYHALISSMQGIRHVFHTAGFVSFNDRDRKKLNHINIDGTANVVNACLEAGIEKLSHVSSIATLGELDINRPVTEEVIWNRGSSASAYAISKYKGEMEVWRGIHEGLNAVIVNPSVIIGPGMWMGPGRQLFYAIQEGLKYYPLGSSGYVDVRDVARIMVSLSGKPVTGERFILNAGQMTHREFMQHLATAFGKQGPEIPVTPLLASAAVISESIRAFFSGSAPRINRRTFKIASENLSYSNNKIREALGFTFIPIEDSVKSSVQLFRDHCR